MASPAAGYRNGMNLNRVLVFIAVACFALVTISAFGDAVSLNEMGFLALGLTCWAAAQVVNVAGRPLTRRPLARR